MSFKDAKGSVVEGTAIQKIKRVHFQKKVRTKKWKTRKRLKRKMGSDKGRHRTIGKWVKGERKVIPLGS